MMIHQREINLLPPPVLKERRFRLYADRLHQLYVMVVIGFVMVAMAYAGAWWTLTQSQAAVQTGVDGGGSQNQEIEEEVRALNNFLRAVQDTVVSRQPWMPFVKQALDAAPAGITITRTALEAIPESLVLAGRSSTREAVVQYEHELAGLSWVERVDAPLKNLASGPEVQFSFTIFRDTRTEPDKTPNSQPAL